MLRRQRLSQIEGGCSAPPGLTSMSHTPIRVRALRVLVVANVKAYRDALVTALKEHDRILAFGQNVESAIASCPDLCPATDAILIDATAPGALGAVVEFCRHSADTPVIAFGVAPAGADIMACAEAGAAGYALADSSIEDLTSAIFAAVSGELVCSPKAAYDLFRLIGSVRTSNRLPKAEFTPREQQILSLLSHGLSNKEIALSLDIAVSTVKNHVHHVLEKSAASSRRHVARKSQAFLAPLLAALPKGKDLVPFMLAT